jgi:hypothetical protein
MPKPVVISKYLRAQKINFKPSCTMRGRLPWLVVMVKFQLVESRFDALNSAQLNTFRNSARNF